MRYMYISMYVSKHLQHLYMDLSKEVAYFYMTNLEYSDLKKPENAFEPFLVEQRIYLRTQQRMTKCGLMFVWLSNRCWIGRQPKQSRNDSILRTMSSCDKPNHIYNSDCVGDTAGTSTTLNVGRGVDDACRMDHSRTTASESEK